VKFRVELREQVRRHYETLGLTYRREVKLALKGLSAGRGEIRALEAPLEGYHRLKIGSHRLIFRHAEGGRIICVYMNTRKLVYEIFEDEVARRILGETR
jgi:mRNA-degrading endonuclease RelE of RelBE toxin-antitoxin system